MSGENEFLSNLKSYGVGNLLDEMTVEQEKVIEAVMRTGRQGKLVIELQYKRTGQNKIQVGSQVRPQVPREALETVQMFTDDQNRLHDEDPTIEKVDPGNVTRIEDHKKVVNRV